jgi:ABC-type uncharacterized transport system substrate-binding protein
MSRPFLGAVLSLAMSAATGLQAAPIVVLKSADAPSWRPALEALRRGLAGQTVAEYDLRGDRAEGQRVVGETLGRAPIYVAFGPIAAQAVRLSAPTSPLVYAMVLDPSGLGLLGVPNCVGVAFQMPVRNQLAALRSVAPQVTRIGVIYSEPSVKAMVDEAVAIAPTLRQVVVPQAVSTPKDVPGALRRLLKGSDAIEALWLVPDPMILGDESRRFLFTQALESGRPVLAFSAALVNEGALVSYGPDIASVGDKVVDLIGRIAANDSSVRGTIVIPNREMVINKTIADRLKLEIPADALAAAKVQ